MNLQIIKAILEDVPEEQESELEWMLLSYLRTKRNLALSVWGVEDVMAVNPALNSYQTIQVVQYLDRNHDATQGINWDVIRETINLLYGYE